MRRLLTAPLTALGLILARASTVCTYAAAGTLTLDGLRRQAQRDWRDFGVTQTEQDIAAGLFPKVKAYEGHLPEGRTGIEFYTPVEPDPGRVPGCPVWSGPRPGVSSVENDPDLVLIAVRIVGRVDR